MFNKHRKMFNIINDQRNTSQEFNVTIFNCLVRNMCIFKTAISCVGENGISQFLVLILEKAMAPHSSTLAWKIPWTEELGRLQSMGSWRVGHEWATSLSLFTFMHWREGNGNPLQCSCLENPRDGGDWWAAIYGVAQSWTRLKRQQQQQQHGTVNLEIF